MLLLNVGGGGRSLPERYAGWEQHLLDVDPGCEPDFCIDAKDIVGNGPLCEWYDAVYTSHTLEHFYQHDVPAVLAGFLYALKPGGLVDIVVPNLAECVREMQARGHDVNDVWYRVNGLPITFHDTLFGWSVAMRQGKMAYAHKCGFTGASLLAALTAAGFTDVQVVDAGANLMGKGRKEGAPCR